MVKIGQQKLKMLQIIVAQFFWYTGKWTYGGKLVASSAADEAENDEEDVDDVQVQLQSAEDVFLGAQLVAALLPANDHLRVEDEELQHDDGGRFSPGGQINSRLISQHY